MRNLRRLMEAHILWGAPLDLLSWQTRPQSSRAPASLLRDIETADYEASFGIT